MTSLAAVVHSDPDIMGGVPVFVGTRVPLRTLLDYLDGGESMDAFLEDFPTVSYRQAVAALWQMAQEQEAFRTAAEYVLAKNAELYRRLA
jgi:uncharacterized protein (DUF433 family)